ncbi:MAG TPA: divalent-cation tolerance protein CutA [candidate division Zixibacteria bacterium]|nr:divalent-cation tolerance protein CutA [candidate division Zixibacteria bacterium]
MSKFGLVLVTVGSEKEAGKIAEILVKEKLAACVNIIPQVKSYFSWQKKFYKGKETLLLIKTRVALFERLENRILKMHSYQIPEIILLPIEKGFKNYLDWIEKETKK